MLCLERNGFRAYGTARRRFTLFPALLLLLLLAPIVVRASSFRFAWLSDTHVGSLTGEEDLRAAVKDINSITGLSFVVHSGDVTEYGSREHLRLAKEIMDGLKIPCHVVPGNHDAKWSESGATDFARFWKDDRFMFEFGGYRFIAIHEGPVMKMADGFWSPQDVRWLEGVLKAMPNTEQPLIFVTHYPLDDGIANWYVVLDLLKKYNIQAALCGHIHRNKKDSFEGVPGIMGRSNLRVNAPAGGYTLVEIQDDGTTTFSERINGGETKKPWHSIVLHKHDFAADTNKYPRPDFSVNARYPNIKERWQFLTGYTIASTPAVTGETAIVGDASGTVYALNLQTGKPVWKFKAANAVYSTPEIRSNIVVFASTDGNVYGLDVAAGVQAWRYHTERPIVASPRISEGLVYIGSSEGKFRALDAATGRLAWEFDGVQGFVETKPLVADGKVIFGAWDDFLYALDAHTGKLAWKWKGDKRGILYSPAACWPVTAAGKVFIVAPDRYMTAIDLKSGDTVWRTGDYMVRESIGLSEDKSRIYVRSMQDNVYAFATDGAEPQKLWERNAEFVYDINSAMLVEKDGSVFYGTKNGVVFALDPRTGAMKWQHRVGVGLVNTVVPLSGSSVLTTDFEGRVAVLDVH